jgi:hypothetical protein
MNQPTKGTFVGAFVEGFVAPFAGFRYMCRHTELWRYGVVPILLNLLITIFVFVLLIMSVVAFATYLHPKFPQCDRADRLGDWNCSGNVDFAAGSSMRSFL